VEKDAESDEQEEEADTDADSDGEQGRLLLLLAVAGDERRTEYGRSVVLTERSEHASESVEQSSLEWLRKCAPDTLLSLAQRRSDDELANARVPSTTGQCGVNVFIEEYSSMLVSSPESV
jgi:hypothetical protein